MSSSEFAPHNCVPLLLQLGGELFPCNWCNNCYNVEFLDFSEMHWRWVRGHQRLELCAGGQRTTEVGGGGRVGVETAVTAIGPTVTCCCLQVKSIPSPELIITPVC